jgi:hypothetical protein
MPLKSKHKRSAKRRYSILETKCNRDAHGYFSLCETKITQLPEVVDLLENKECDHGDNWIQLDDDADEDEDIETEEEFFFDEDTEVVLSSPSPIIIEQLSILIQETAKYRPVGQNYGRHGRYASL